MEVHMGVLHGAKYRGMVMSVFGVEVDGEGETV